MAIGLAACASSVAQTQPARPSGVARMRLTSPAFTDGGVLPKQYTCAGEDPSRPDLHWSTPPPGTKELALVVVDPAVGEDGYVHYLFWGLSPQRVSATEGSAAGGLPGMNGEGREHWAPPCPVSGSPHTYEFRVLALDRHPDVLMTANLRQFSDAIRGSVIGEGLLTATSGT
jgi:phosphatidylethanolamine-binding protein (PEBP) family uncharacterized protein